MKCRVLVLMLTGSLLVQLGCGSGDGIKGAGKSGGAGGSGSAGASGTAGTGGSAGIGGSGSAGIGGNGSAGAGGSGGDIPSCSDAFNACGGDLTGKWAVDGLCIEGDVKSLLAGATATSELPPECSDLFQGVSVEMSGTIEYANGKQISNVTTTMDMRIKYTSACLSAQGGTSMTMTKSLCDTLELTMNSDTSSEDDMKRTVSCSFSTSCNCTMHQTGQSKDEVGYTVNGGTLSTDDGETAQYCVSGQNLTVRDKSSGDVAGQTKLRRI